MVQEWTQTQIKCQQPLAQVPSCIFTGMWGCTSLQATAEAALRGRRAFEGRQGGASESKLMNIYSEESLLQSMGLKGNSQGLAGHFGTCARLGIQVWYDTAERLPTYDLEDSSSNPFSAMKLLDDHGPVTYSWLQPLLSLLFHYTIAFPTAEFNCCCCNNVNSHYFLYASPLFNLCPHHATPFSFSVPNWVLSIRAQ